MQEQIYKKDFITIFASNEEKRLKLRVVQETVSKEKITIYEAVLESLADGDKLSDNFENFQQVIEQIKDNPNGVEVDLKKPAIVISASVVGKKAKQVTLGVIPLHQKETIVKQLEEVLLMKVIEVCNSKAELTSDLTKELLQNISVGLKLLLEERKQMKEWRIKTEEMIKRLQEKNEQLQNSIKLIKEKEAHSDKRYQYEQLFSIQNIEEGLSQNFQQQWSQFTKKHEEGLQYKQKLKNILRIGFQVIAEMLQGYNQVFDKNIQKLLPITPQNQDKYIYFLSKQKSWILKLMALPAQFLTQNLQINNIHIDEKQLQNILFQSSKKTTDLLSEGKPKPSESQTKQLILDQIKFINKNSRTILQKIHKSTSSMEKSTQIELLNTAIYDYTRSSLNNSITYNYYDFCSALALYWQELYEYIVEYGKTFWRNLHETGIMVI